MDPRSSTFWQAAVKLGLIEESALQQCWEAIPADKRTPDAVDRRLARQAVNAGHISLWQAQQMLAGRQAALKIDRYLLQDLLGHGGMGRVYLARDTRLNRLVAIKIISRERMSNPRALTRFRREARVGAQLQHENLIRVYDEGRSHNIPYLVMEYISGQTVGQMIASQGKLPFPMAADLARQVALGLEHLHQKGLLHRDVNPLNILVDREGTAKLTDLGLAIDLGDLDEAVTRDGATVGTFDYISPEQARHSRGVDLRSDIYSLGCTLYQMITGRPPFPAPSLPEKLIAHQSQMPDPLPSVVPGVPEGLDQVVRTMMAKQPDDRYQRALLAAKALEPYSARNGVIPPGLAYQRPAVRPDASAVTIEAPALTASAARSQLVARSGLVPSTPAPAGAGAGAVAAAAEAGTATATPGLVEGSDPDLAGAPGRLAPLPPGTTNVTPTSGGTDSGTSSPSNSASLGSADPLRIDLGPEPPLRESLSGVRSRRGSTSQTFPRFERFRPLFGERPGRAALVAGLAGLAALGLLAWTLGLRDGSGRAPGASGSPAAGTKADGTTTRNPASAPTAGANTSRPGTTPEPSRPALSVEFRDGTVQPVKDLREAIRFAAGKPAAIVFRNAGPLTLDVTEPLDLTDGDLTLRAGGGTTPMLVVVFKQPVTWLRLSAQSKLRVEGLAIQASATQATPEGAAAPVLFQVPGDLELVRSKFTAVGPERRIRVTQAEGLRTLVQGCFFDGYDQPLGIRLMPGSTTQVQQTLVVRASATVLPTAWALSLQPYPAPEGGPPARLVVQDTTVVGLGLLGLTAPTPGRARVTAQVERTVVSGRTLLMWDEPFPGTLQWAGRGNRYQISGPVWAVRAPDAAAPLPGSATNLATWATGPIQEPESSDAPSMRFATSSPSEAMSPADFTLSGESGLDAGIDPAQVGPLQP